MDRRLAACGGGSSARDGRGVRRLSPHLVWHGQAFWMYDLTMIPKTLEAVVEGGLLRPLDTLGLPEHQHVMLTIVTLKDDARAAMSCYDLAQSLGVIGVGDDSPPDLSTSSAYIEGFGTR
ncbi:MAG: antitoxin family protein [Planctomycetes bacterium]|nr:antitoxin family protein [Planctomycetota bacterium]